MDVNPEPVAPVQPNPAAGELILQTGRQAGTRRPLNVPLTFIGRSSGCDLRLNAEGVAPLHCLIAHGPAGVVVRDLDSPTGTTVNGSLVTVQPLRDGDILDVGPFQFRLHLPLGCESVPETQETNHPEKEALRIQAAAVAAQQAVLLDEEARLQQQRGTLEQQESQLANHLEEKRCKLVQLTEQAQMARAALQQERATYQEHVDRVTRDLSAAQREMVEGQQNIQTERQRLSELRRRLEQRAERQLEGDRNSLRQRMSQLAATQKQFEQQQERLRQDRETLHAERLRFNGDSELGRRELQDARLQFQKEQQQAKERQAQEQAALRRERHELAIREAALADGRRVFGDEQYAWERRLNGLVAEADGLENRIHHQRLLLQEQQQQLEQLTAQVRARREEAPSAEPAVEIPPATPGEGMAPDQPKAEESAAQPQLSPVASSSLPEPEQLAVDRGTGVPPVTTQETPRAGRLGHDQAAPAERVGQEQFLEKRLAALEKLACDLADQRAQLVEQWQRLAQLQQQWQQDGLATAAQLEAALAGFPEREEELTRRLHAIEAAEAEVGHRLEENLKRRQELEAWAARLQAEQVCYQSERDHLMADLRSREEVAEKNLVAVVDLRERWARRRRQELDLLRAERVRCEKVRKECAILREELWQRGVVVEDERRSLAEKTLVLEQYKQETILRASDAAGAERRVERLRLRWRTQEAALLKETEEKRQALFAEATRLEERQAALQKHLEALAVQQANLAQRQAEWEQEEVLAGANLAKSRQQLHSALVQRDRQEQQIRELREEIERIAETLLADHLAVVVPQLKVA